MFTWTFRYTVFKHSIFSTAKGPTQASLCLHVCSVTTSTAYPCRVGAAPHNHRSNHQRDWDPDPDPWCQRHQSAADEWVQILFQPLWQGTAHYPLSVQLLSEWSQAIWAKRSRAGGGDKLVFRDGPVTVSIMTKMPSLERCLCARCWKLPDPRAAFSSWPYIWPKTFSGGGGGLKFSVGHHRWQQIMI